MTWSDIKAAVFLRAGDFCEAWGARGVERHGHGGRAVADHWLQGRGRRVEQQAVSNVWGLCLPCNEARTLNSPSAGFWNDLFAAHCERHDLPFTPHKDLAILTEAGIGVRRP